MLDGTGGAGGALPPEIQGHSMPVEEELGVSFSDASLLRGATAQLLLKNRSEIFSSNVLSSKDVAELHQTTSVVEFLDDFFSHSWATSRFDKWAALLLHLNAQAAAIGMVLSAVLWGVAENCSIIPKLLVANYPGLGGGESTCMPILVGFSIGVLFTFQWQRIRALFGLRPRMCFLDKVCIDQVDEARKSAGIASLGAFLGASKNFVVLFSPDYFKRLWCCYELAAFRHLQVTEEQKITFLPVACPRVLFVNAFGIALACLPHALLPIIGPWIGIDPNNVTDNDYNMVMLPGSLVTMWTMAECQKYAAAREQIDAQLENFSIERAECFDEKDRPRVEREIAKWFGDGDRAEGIRKFDEYVKTDVRGMIEEMVGKRKFLGGEIPWLFCFLSGAGAILEDISGFVEMSNQSTWQDQLMNFIGCASCSMVGTPMCTVVYLWLARKEFRFWGGWPMIFLAPVIGWAVSFTLIVGFLSTNLTFCVIQFCLVMPFGAWVYRDSLSKMLGLQKQGEEFVSQKQKAFAMVPSQEEES